ncbi:TlpA family protein disulfide reductase [Sphingobacterium psychroaquaticum]|uniref:Peroxiredoxin n=1 Tax=Sphingobacterium psychroaquaticum TaxID=561061 RepID=A0A1X7L4Z8_9SPHI|nr:TlpA disulfide reductase family protein [Sphingobacterium psychroaquaticum]QBQ42282.1 AhpC/TSA family protein [Sphingobacterium psychroaquaticum]SMG48840.1 Peroxiredoxin [Sphingobacterium psychroaquaticum]
MKKLVMLLLSVILVSSVTAQYKIKVKGYVTGQTEGHNNVYLYNQIKKDTAVIKDGYFEFNMVEPTAGSRAIAIEYDQKKHRMYSPVVLFWDQSGTIEVRFDIQKGLSSTTLSGMPSAVTFANHSAARSKAFMEIRAQVQAKYGADALKQGADANKEAMAYMEKLSAQKYDSLLNTFVDGKSMLAPVLILSHISNLPTDRLENYYSRLSKAVKESEEGQTLNAKIQGLKNAYVGATVTNFSLPDENGKQRSFEEFKGKYILLDFWASWCSPCRASFPRIREVYDKLKGQNFIVINVSIDKNKEAWLKAVGEENNPWPQLYDDSKMAYARFNVSAVPTSYLIDPSGKIIMKEIGFDPKGGGAMELKLEEIFKTKF